jgi:acetyl-CoA carboxylase carboxyltransferase component
MSYDYTVLAGTQGMRNHLKKDRLFEIAERRRLPVVLFAECGGGRPGDVDWPIVAGLDCRAFHLFARLSGLVPLVGITSGYCFAGNAALLGGCDVVIATEDSSTGMGGPAMIAGGGLGLFEPDEVGPIDVQWPGGVVDTGAGRGRERRRCKALSLVLQRAHAAGPAEGPDPTAARDPHEPQADLRHSHGDRRPARRRVRAAGRLRPRDLYPEPLARPRRRRRPKLRAAVPYGVHAFALSKVHNGFTRA